MFQTENYDIVPIFIVFFFNLGVRILGQPFQHFCYIESQSSCSRKDIGIWLALAKEFITRHGGNIPVTSITNSLPCTRPKSDISFNIGEYKTVRDPDTTHIQFPPTLQLPTSSISEIPLNNPFPCTTTPLPTRVAQLIQNLNPYTYFQRTSQPTTTPQPPIVNEFYPENQFAPNTTPLHIPPLQCQCQTLEPQPEFVQPQFIGAYPDQGIIEQVLPEEEINLRRENFEEINLVEILEELEGIQEEINYQVQEPEEEVHSEPESEATIEEPEPERNMAEEALTAAAKAMTTLANALGRDELACTYMKDNAQEWLASLEHAQLIFIIVNMTEKLMANMSIVSHISLEKSSVPLNKKQPGKNNYSKLNKAQTQLIPILAALNVTKDEWIPLVLSPKPL
ncbi:hypothetical protein C2G38_2212188 [Gigaspora rosea]|uniref:Uncharacterized protein n=1 Tax=Gigaspora rosea TaxID=44941 RepID=A0A397UDJ4_9GLOM|nr:hypothetical protein C2G38_2212188 [Gigaspora rosea]